VLLAEVILPRLTEDDLMNIQHSEPTTPLRACMISDITARTLGPASQTSHLRACKRFAAWFGRSPETATPDDVKYFQQHLVEIGTSICTRNQTMTGVKFLFRVTMRRHDLVAEIFSLKEPVKVPLVLSKKEIKRILAMAPSQKARVMLSLAYGCGMRAGEVVRLKVGDIDGEQKIIRIVQSKGRKDRNVPRPERVLFPGYRGKHLSARQISRLFKQTALEARITKPVTLHTLRHSFATHLLERGVDIRVIQALLGHTKLTTTARYASVATGMIAAVDSPLDDLNGPKRPAWRATNTGHVSLTQLKVMSAIERCRTAALGGHVTRCADCAHEHIAYNSCRNRHCPKCQAGAAKAWLAAREAELLPVRYFHLVFTLPKQIADIAHQNKREIYNLLMRASADTVPLPAAHSGRPDQAA
jgi:integrase/recombinase XerD